MSRPVPVLEEERPVTEPRTIIQPLCGPVRATHCGVCTYEMRAHRDGRCPTEDEAVKAWGRS